MVIVLVALAAQALLASGCGEGKSPPPRFYHACSNEYLDYPPEPGPCGCTAPSFAGQGNCPQPVPGGGGVVSTLTAAAGTATSGSTASRIARSLQSDAAATETGGQLAQGEAASAGAVAQDGPDAGDGAGSTDSRRGGPFQPGRKGAGRGSRIGGLGGGLSGFGDLKTLPMGEDAATGPSGPLDGSGGGSYASGSGPGGAEYGGYRSAANDDGGDASGGTSTDEFGGDSGESAKELSLDDPEDYFTRLGLDDSLFKVIERRYRAKSTAWTTQELRGFKSSGRVH